MSDLEKQIADCTRKLNALREEFDRLDANHPHQSIQISRDIAECVKELEALLKKGAENDSQEVHVRKTSNDP